MCSSTKKDGSQCKSNAMTGSEYCFFHNPSISSTQRKQAQIKGGKNRRSRVISPLAPLPLHSSEDIVKLLASTITEVRAGSIDVKIANCIGVLSSHLLRAIEVVEFEKRLQALENLHLT